MFRLFTRKCRHAKHGAYHTRFGDVCCRNCHFPLGWHPSLVRGGVFGDHTSEWVRTQYDHHVRTDEGRKLLEAGENYSV